MAAHRSSFLLYQGSQEWRIDEPRDSFEVGWATTSGNFNKSLPVIDYYIPLENGAQSKKLSWYISLNCYNSLLADGKPGLNIYVYTNTNGSAFGKPVGLKSVLKVLDENNKIIKSFKGYYNFNGSSAYHCSNGMCWSIKLEDISLESPFIRVCCTYQLYDLSTGAVPAQSDDEKRKALDGNNKPQPQCTEALALMLDKDRVAGVSTDAILKHGDKEYKVHKCVLSLQSEFFKARFSDRWEVKDGAAQTVDLNDPDLSPVLLEALISGAYTGKVENFDVAMKLLPVADKYQFQKLKEVCESTISCNLTRSNVLSIHLLASQFGAIELQQKCEALVKM